jgi:hypothetical protein
VKTGLELKENPEGHCPHIGCFTGMGQERLNECITALDFAHSHRSKNENPSSEDAELPIILNHPK